MSVGVGASGKAFSRHIMNGRLSVDPIRVLTMWSGIDKRDAFSFSVGVEM